MSSVKTDCVISSPKNDTHFVTCLRYTWLVAELRRLEDEHGESALQMARYIACNNEKKRLCSSWGQG